MFDNVDSVLSTAYKLRDRGVIDDMQIQRVQADISDMCADDVVPV